MRTASQLGDRGRRSPKAPWAVGAGGPGGLPGGAAEAWRRGGRRPGRGAGPGGRLRGGAPGGRPGQRGGARGGVGAARADGRGPRGARYLFLFDKVVIVCKRRGYSYELKEVIELLFHKMTDDPMNHKDVKKVRPPVAAEGPRGLGRQARDRRGAEKGGAVGQPPTPTPCSARGPAPPWPFVQVVLVGVGGRDLDHGSPVRTLSTRAPPEASGENQALEVGPPALALVAPLQQADLPARPQPSYCGRELWVGPAVACQTHVQPVGCGHDRRGWGHGCPIPWFTPASAEASVPST